ncbi:uncharacterized protein SPSC_01795 [Sporisorium scitamineum]|nr:uncharacterized protein SPSC_01795 [Sporisorium scitamineum]
MAAIRPAPPVELPMLTLDHILTDLETLPFSNALFALAQPAAQPSGSRTSTDLLQSFEAGVTPSSQKQYVELSHQLLASHRRAQRLNGERVSAAQVGLVLPSERKSRVEGEEELTRTDLLHAKVADLQTRVDAWEGALQQAVQAVESPARHGAAEEVKGSEAETSRVEHDAPESVESGMAHDHIEQTALTAPTSTVNPATLTQQRDDQKPPKADPPSATSAPEDVFEDDDPWNDLT